MVFSYGVFSKKKIIPGDRRLLFYSLLSGVFLGVHFLLWMESLFYIPVAISTTIVVSYPLYNVLVDAFLFREKVSVLQTIGFAGGFTGILLLLNPGFHGAHDLYGVLLALGGSLAASAYFSIGRIVRSSEGLISYIVPAYSSATLTTLFYITIIGGSITGYSMSTYVFFMLLAFIPMIGGHTVMNYMLKYMKTSSVTAIALGEPVGASILAYVFLGQEIGLHEALIMALILSSISLIVYEEAGGR